MKTLGQAGQNVELTNFSPGHVTTPARSPPERMQNEATEARAEGVVGVDLHEGNHVRGAARHRVLRRGHGRRADLERAERVEDLDPQLVLSVNS